MKIKILKNLGARLSKSGKSTLYLCIAKCFCGNEFEAYKSHIKSGHTKSCGCIRKVTHKVREQPEYSTLINMKARCYNKNSINYKYYGGRGITICEKWRKDSWAFINWCRANGYKKGLQIDRKENDKGYSPENCRFVTRSINQQNTRLLSSHNTSGYRGVRKKNKKWCVEIKNKGEQHHLGYYSTKELAAQVYNNYVIDNKTEHPLNIIKEET